MATAQSTAANPLHDPPAPERAGARGAPLPPSERSERAPERAAASSAPERAAASGAPLPEFVLLLNPDTEIIGDAIPRMVQYLLDHPDVVVVGPQLRYADGNAQASRRRFPRRLTYVLESTPLAQWWPNNPWVQRYQMADVPDTHEQRVDWLVGAALLVRSSAIVRAGLLDAGFHMYSEELEWQARLGQHGKIVYLPSAVITHHEGKSSEQAIARRYITFQRSRVREAGMRYGSTFAALLRILLKLLYAGELVTEAAKWLVGHKRSLRAERVRVYAQVVRGV